jgi:hypothetical protein
MACREVKSNAEPQRQFGGFSPLLKMIAHIQVRGMMVKWIAELLDD